MFNSDAKFPAVMRNVDVTLKVNFLGGAIDDFLDIGEYLAYAFAMNAPSIPPTREKLWKAFYKAMKDKRPIQKTREDYGLFLGEEDSNEFTLVLNKYTYQ